MRLPRLRLRTLPIAVAVLAVLIGAEVLRRRRSHGFWVFASPLRGAA